tara:strand:- start:60 stop:569 length:510 start_codon:yes stop_codon:yes gene_type:complete
MIHFTRIGSPSFYVLEFDISLRIHHGPLRSLSGSISFWVGSYIAYGRIVCKWFLTFSTPLLKQTTYIAGITNPIFDDKLELWDVLYSFTKKKPGVQLGQGCKIKPNSEDKIFMRNVLQGIDSNADEDWVRERFRDHTRTLLCKVEEINMNPKLAFASSVSYTRSDVICE